MRISRIGSSTSGWCGREVIRPQHVQRGLRTVWVVVALAACASACSSEPQNVLDIQAGVYTREKPTITALVEMPGLRFALADAQIHGQSFQMPVTARSGDIRITFIVTKSVTDTIGRGEVTLPITRGHNYSANLFRQPAGLGYGCFGCTGSKRYPLIGSERGSTDTLWLYYTNAEPLCKGCVAERGVREPLLVAEARDD